MKHDRRYVWHDKDSWLPMVVIGIVCLILGAIILFSTSCATPNKDLAQGLMRARQSLEQYRTDMNTNIGIATVEGENSADAYLTMEFSNAIKESATDGKVDVASVETIFGAYETKRKTAAAKFANFDEKVQTADVNFINAISILDRIIEYHSSNGITKDMVDNFLLSLEKAGGAYLDYRATKAEKAATGETITGGCVTKGCDTQ